MDEVSFVLDQIRTKNYVILPDTIANGEVYKVSFLGNLEKDGYEISYLYLSIGSSIKRHMHLFDMERYKILSGELKIGGVNQKVNICKLGESHCIDKVFVETIIQTCKVRKEYLSVGDNFSDEYVEKLICEVMRENGYE